MKHSLLAVVALSLLAAPAFAQEGEHKGPPPGGRGNHFMEKVDTDKDGKVSRAEFQAKGDDMFKEADSNNDGYITKEEAKAAHEARRAKWQAKRAEFKKTQAQQSE